MQRQLGGGSRQWVQRVRTPLTRGDLQLSKINRQYSAKDDENQLENFLGTRRPPASPLLTQTIAEHQAKKENRFPCGRSCREQERDPNILAHVVIVNIPGILISIAVNPRELAP